MVARLTLVGFANVGNTRAAPPDGPQTRRRGAPTHHLRRSAKGWPTRHPPWAVLAPRSSRNTPRSSRLNRSPDASRLATNRAGYSPTDAVGRDRRPLPAPGARDDAAFDQRSVFVGAAHHEPRLCSIPARQRLWRVISRRRSGHGHLRRGLGGLTPAGRAPPGA